MKVVSYAYSLTLFLKFIIHSLKQLIYSLCCAKLGFGENIDWVSYKEGVALSKQR